MMFTDWEGVVVWESGERGGKSEVLVTGKISSLNAKV